MIKLHVEEMEKTNGGNTGAGAAGCIGDAYTGHGWISVGLWIETLVIPEAGIVIAVACAVH